MLCKDGRKWAPYVNRVRTRRQRTNESLPLLPANPLQPKIRAQIAEALSRQYQMTQLSQQSGTKGDKTPSPFMSVRSSFGSPVPATRRVPGTGAGQTLEPRTPVPSKQSRRYLLKAPKERLLGPDALGGLSRNQHNIKDRANSSPYSRICRFLPASDSTGRGLAHGISYSAGLSGQAALARKLEPLTLPELRKRSLKRFLLYYRMKA